MVDRDQRISTGFDYQISPFLPCPHLPDHLLDHLPGHLLDLWTHLRAFHRHCPTRFPLTKPIIIIVAKPATYTCNFILLQVTQSSWSYCKLFYIKKHRLSCYPFCAPDHFGWHRCKVLHSSKTLPDTAWRCYTRSAPSASCSRIQKDTFGFNAQNNPCVDSRRR